MPAAGVREAGRRQKCLRTGGARQPEQLRAPTLQSVRHDRHTHESDAPRGRRPCSKPAGPAARTLHRRPLDAQHRAPRQVCSELCRVRPAVPFPRDERQVPPARWKQRPTGKLAPRVTFQSVFACPLSPVAHKVRGGSPPVEGVSCGEGIRSDRLPDRLALERGHLP